MLHRLCDRVAAILRILSWIAFAALIITVALQVLARDILAAPMIWTGDVAQLLFTWLIFIGAAAGLRLGSHYTVDLLPMHRRTVKLSTDWIGFVAGVLVALLLLICGWELTMIRSTAVVQSLGISRFWMFLPLPLSGAFMILFLAEMLQDLLTRRVA
ncbi:TRAP-type C4-dicarboxylate transport system permease small subunit [Breoghania corrubedonensis]|uniref:TRAP transporter small permease protein n=1 Tax=Breoghania corrubedonensis TaxID=665038 RepID=A0A2T5V7Z1_9HYPH|nr:TRAP transporter small permease subunit [Breoghania corrubedonensis]PTW59872.1 TRAP-type C4-dicarboxylate transport system permease small subunit [Breoghania corrubedonensis]